MCMWPHYANNEQMAYNDYVQIAVKPSNRSYLPLYLILRPTATSHMSYWFTENRGQGHP